MHPHPGVFLCDDAFRCADAYASEAIKSGSGSDVAQIRPKPVSRFKPIQPEAIRI
jgi:hypothetical protein